MTEAAEMQPKAGRAFGRLRLAAVVFALLGALGLAGYNAALPYEMKVTVSELTREDDGSLAGDFSLPWPLKINKTAVADIRVTLPGGSELKQYESGADFYNDGDKPGFFVNRPMIVLRLGPAAQATSDTVLSVTLPAKTRDILYHLPFGLAAFLFLASWLGPGLRASLAAPKPRVLAVAGGAVALALGGFFGLAIAEGVAVWLALLALLLGPVIAATLLLQAETEASGRRSPAREPLIKLALLLGTVLGCCILFEAYLAWDGARAQEEPSSSAEATNDWFLLPDEVARRAAKRSEVLTLPDAWRRREETVGGATSAYTWHGALHVHDKWGFRRLDGPFPAKDPDRLRVMVVGDSLTYGYGIEDRWTYSKLLERSLQDSHRLEVANLGRSGYQSEDMVWVLRKFLPQLDPDLVIYAVCLNDFLPSGQGQYAAYPFPLPEDWKLYLSKRTNLARLFEDAYQSLLLALDLQSDFFDDILAGKADYQARFARDVAAMNDFVRGEGLPPIIGMVFHQSPGGDPRAWELIEVAERALADADFDLISVMSWRERFKGQAFPVSRWEGHPNELAHSLVAQSLNERLLRHPRLEGYRIEKP